MLKRIKEHPVLEVPQRQTVAFTWNGEEMTGYRGEMVSSALMAAGVNVFGHHHRDGSPQGIFCANGQCAQCLVIIDGKPAKSCMTPLEEGMNVESVEGLPRLPEGGGAVTPGDIPVEDTEVLIVGGGPAGLSAALELGRLGVDTLLADDKDRLGGKLVLQTHKFFGSVKDSNAGTRGYEIGRLLADDVRKQKSVRVWLKSTVVGVFSDGLVGVVKGKRYVLVRPKALLVATGARERMLSFPGNTLPGVYGAGAFQTLVNRDLVRCSDRVMIVGGGNVGLIAGYHAVQAGIEVVGVVEALPRVGGYKVHADKLRRLGVPIHTGHTVVSANGKERVESVTIARLDENWNVVKGTERTFKVDTVLVAVGLTEVDEFLHKARAFGITVGSAGDAQEIAEASAAMFSGRIEGLKLAGKLGYDTGEVPQEWEEKLQVLKSRPGPVHPPAHPDKEEGVMPVFHCYQEIPCNPCTSVCPVNGIHTHDDDIMKTPYFEDEKRCVGCLSCVGICPGLAITVVDYRKEPENPIVTLPCEMGAGNVAPGEAIPVTDDNGEVLGNFEVVKVIEKPRFPGTLLVQVKVPREIAKSAAGVWRAEIRSEALETYEGEPLPDEAIVCRCERVTAGEIRTAIRAGVRDMNQLKALTRAGMGACGSKTCRPMIWRIFREEGVDLEEVTDRIDRPLFVEVPLGYFAGVSEGGEGDD